MFTTNKFSNKIVVFAIALIISFTSMISVDAADYTTNYSSYPTPTTNDYAYWNGSRVVRAPGTTTSEIKGRQSALNYCITYKGVSASKLALDGSFGPACKKAALAFQKKYGLAQDGSFGPKTITKMISILPKTSSKTTSVSTTAVKTTAAAASKTLSINWSNINKTGRQTVKGPCGCYALAYCRDILDNKAHSWTEYSADNQPKWNSYDNGPKEYRYSYALNCSKGGYRWVPCGSSQNLFKDAYNNINAGKPVVINVKGGRSTGNHYIAIVGYTNVKNVNALSISNFLMIDSAASKLGIENAGSVRYVLKSTDICKK